MGSRLVQDINIKPTQQEAQEAISYLSHLCPEQHFVICEGRVGSWRMHLNGETCFYCPPIHLPPKGGD